MTELEDAIRLANRVLDKPWIDPDGDICMLARQFLRARERIAELEKIAPSQSEAIRAEVIAQGVDPSSDEAERMGRAARQNMLRKARE